MLYGKGIALGLLCLVAAISMASPSVRIDSMKQRYPWNGLVDVGYTVSGIEDGHAYDFRLLARVNGVSKQVEFQRNPHCKFASEVEMNAGSYKAIWNAADDFPETYAATCELYPTISDLGVERYPADATGEPVGILASVMVVDISGGTSATNYPVEYWPLVDTGRFNCDVYKISKLPLRRISRGIYTVGWGTESYSAAAGNLSRATVTATNHFWIGLFELTQGQYSRVCTSGCSGAVSGDTQPTSNNSISSLRGSGSFLEHPTGDTFFANLNGRTMLDARECWDLPTRSQWDIASRGEVLCRYQTGDTMNTTEIRDYAVVGTSSSYVVGSKLPNTMGLYDMNGNMWEAVLGYFVGGQCDPSFVDTPSMANSSTTLICGGSWLDGSDWGTTMQISSHYLWGISSTQNNVGARPAVICR